MDKERTETFRSISNLSFGSQSAYRRFHSTETSLLKVHIAIAEALHECSMAALIMLNIYPGFDVMNHQILLKCLECSFGIKEKA